MSAIEEFTMSYPDQEYHFTLYYYDQAGNLIRTVPPKAVSRFTDQDSIDLVQTRRSANQWFTPMHARKGKEPNYLATEYRYNSLNQPIEQKTPDGGTSEFWYDELGRLVVSQNASQRPDDEYSYTRFDEQGRITEVGEAENVSTGMNSTISTDFPTLDAWIVASTLTEITRSYYDINPQINTSINPLQKNLRKRVVAMTYEDADDGDSSTYESASFYSYDIHGNVKRLWQENTAVAAIDPDLSVRTMHYYYDLVSGNVNSVAYNPGEPDQFFHNYEYDADNRIVSVKTWEGTDFAELGFNGWNPGKWWVPGSRHWDTISNPLNAITIWPFDEDANYDYYRHGPLSRTEIGELKVQGMDYIFTIQNRIKSLNSNTLSPGRDPGRDGDTVGVNPHEFVARDAYGYMLDYFSGDFMPINGDNNFMATKNVSGYGQNIIDLFNGNVSAMTTTLKEPITFTISPQGTEYTYDQFNRLKGMHAYQNLNLSTNTWGVGVSLKDYIEDYSYDYNGNILSLRRNGHNSIDTAMDNLTYFYNLRTNQLNYVDDGVSAGVYTNDIDDQGSGNFAYDNVGNLIQDIAGEISNIEWTAYGRIKSITRTPGSLSPNIEFAYGPNGERVSKKMIYDYSGVINDSIITIYYVKDNRGKPMTTYRHVVNSVASDEYYVMEQFIYGNTRLGCNNLGIDLLNIPLPATGDYEGIAYVDRGNRKYELSEHRGNVLIVVTDRRTVGSCTGDIADYYEADIIMACDYSSFGVLLEGRSWLSNQYRYGMQGQEKDDEWSGSGNMYAFEYRVHDARLGRFLSVDPLAYNYAWNSPYNFCENKVIEGVDIEGLEYTSNATKMLQLTDGRVDLVIENMSTVSINNWQNTSNNTSTVDENGNTTSIGLSRTIGNLSAIHSTPQTPDATNVNSEAENPQTLPNTTSSIKSEGSNRAGKREVAKGKTLINTPGSGNVSKGLVIVEAATIVALNVQAAMSWWDEVKVYEHIGYLNSAIGDVNEALKAGLIPIEYQTEESLLAIISVVYSGENPTDDPKIYEIGMYVYDMISTPIDIYYLSDSDLNATTPGDATDVNTTISVPETINYDLDLPTIIEE